MSLLGPFLGMQEVESSLRQPLADSKRSLFIEQTIFLQETNLAPRDTHSIQATGKLAFEIEPAVGTIAIVGKKPCLA